MATVAFELGISLGEVSKVRFERVAVPKLDDTWFVQLDGDVVTVHARGGQIGHAAWVRSRLIERSGQPSDEQWQRIGTALARVLKRAAPEKRRLPKFLIGPIIFGILAIIGTAVIVHVRSDDPPRQLAQLTWTDVAAGGETTPRLIHENAERERGRKLCVMATIDQIEASKLEGKDVHVGMLSAGGEQIAFVALRSARSLEPGSTARFCGVANGRRILGLFDLPENR